MKRRASDGCFRPIAAVRESPLSHAGIGASKAPGGAQAGLKRLAPPGALPVTGSVWGATHTTTGPATGHPGRAQRACEAPSSAGFGARARSALRALTRCVCSTTVSAASGGSYATGPRGRAAQGSRSAAKTAPPARWGLPGCLVAEALVACVARHTDAVAGKAPGGAWAGRIGTAEERRSSGRARIWRASSSDSAHVFERSERSERSELCDGPEDRAPQGTCSEAKGQPFEPRPGPARRLARADASMRKRTLANDRNGPQPAARFGSDFISAAARRCRGPSGRPSAWRMPRRCRTGRARGRRCDRRCRRSIAACCRTPASAAGWSRPCARA